MTSGLAESDSLFLKHYYFLVLLCVIYFFFRKNKQKHQIPSFGGAKTNKEKKNIKFWK